jgi:hypothetical protein
MVTLVLSKNLGASMIVLILAPVVLLAGLRTQLIVAAAFAGMVLTYPVLRSRDLIPNTFVIETIETFSPERASSFAYRVRNEDMLLEKANEKSLLGWGSYSRGRVFNEKGYDISITDGGWIILYGFGGWMQYTATFGLLTLPVMLIALTRRRADLTVATAGLAVTLTAQLIDLLPNSGALPIAWLITGALIGRLEAPAAELAAARNAPEAESEPPSREGRLAQGPVYRRDLSGKTGNVGPVRPERESGQPTRLGLDKTPRYSRDAGRRGPSFADR